MLNKPPFTPTLCLQINDVNREFKPGEEAALKATLLEEGESIRVPYKQNRAIIFVSDQYHVRYGYGMIVEARGMLKHEDNCLIPPHTHTHIHTHTPTLFIILNSEPFEFKDGYENQRVNLTLLFGDRLLLS
jgi:hypothetical protein